MKNKYLTEFIGKTSNRKTFSNAIECTHDRKCTTKMKNEHAEKNTQHTNSFNAVENCNAMTDDGNWDEEQQQHQLQ